MAPSAAPADTSHAENLAEEFARTQSSTDRFVKKLVGGIRKRMETIVTDRGTAIRERGDRLKEFTSRKREELQELRAEMEDTVRRETELIRSFVKDEQRRLRESIERRRQHLRELRTRPSVVKTYDKISFTGGIICLMLTELIFVKYPERMHQWYMLWSAVLLPLRLVLYTRVKYQYFLLDFCYFMQVYLLSFLVFVHSQPDSAWHFKTLFVASNGPLLMAVPLWKNQLVFHSIDKVTSVFIHIMPPLVTFCIRWFPTEYNHIFDQPGAEALTLRECFLYPLAVHTFWQTLYTCKVEVFDRKKLDNDPSLQTSFRWMRHKNGDHSKSARILQTFGASLPAQLFVWISCNAIYIFLTIVPVYWVYTSFWLHLAYFLAVLGVCIYNGAEWYIDVFSRKYMVWMEAVEEEHRLHAEALTTLRTRSEDGAPPEPQSASSGAQPRRRSRSRSKKSR